MKTALLGFIIILALAACKHSLKDPDLAMIDVAIQPKEDSNREIFTDRFGDQIEVITNTAKDRITVKLDGKTYELKKDLSSSAYSTDDNIFQYTSTKNEISFLKRNSNMVLFHAKKEKPSTKMASQ